MVHGSLSFRFFRFSGRGALQCSCGLTRILSRSCLAFLLPSRYSVRLAVFLFFGKGRGALQCSCGLTRILSRSDLAFLLPSRYSVRLAVPLFSVFFGCSRFCSIAFPVTTLYHTLRKESICNVAQTLHKVFVSFAHCAKSNACVIIKSKGGRTHGRRKKEV